jgi:hypothetical protein
VGKWETDEDADAAFGRFGLRLMQMDRPGTVFHTLADLFLPPAQTLAVFRKMIKHTERGGRSFIQN